MAQDEGTASAGNGSGPRRRMTGFTIDRELLDRADRHWRLSGIRSRSRLVEIALREYLDHHEKALREATR